MNKKISVVMSAYNEPERFLRESIESILNQTYRDFEFIIIQDKPDNETIERVVNEYAAKDDRIRFYKNEKNIGLAMSLNRGIELARYDIIARMDADDISLPERFEKELAYLEEHPQYHMITPNRIGIDENGNEIRSLLNFPENFDNLNRKEAFMDLIQHSGVVFFKRDLMEVGCYRNFPAAQDRDLWLRYLTNNWAIGFQNECLLKYRFSPNNTTTLNALRQWVCIKYALELFRERKKKNKDSFSEEILKKKLDMAGCNSLSSKQRFIKGRSLIFEGGTALRKHNYFKVLINVVKAFFMHKKMPAFIYYAMYNKIFRDGF